MNGRKTFMLQPKSSFESVYRAFFYFVLLFLGFLWFFEYRYAVQPCVLSYLERMILLALAVIFWVSFVYHHTSSSRKAFSWIGFVTCLLGIVTVSRHLWVQQMKKGLLYVDQSQQFLLAVKQAFLGEVPACSQIYKLVWDIRLTELILIVFIGLAVVCFLQQFKKISVT
jgi:disulfide bond formation protein DsbB